MQPLKAVTQHERQHGVRSLNIALPSALCQAISTMAEIEDRSVANMIRVLLREALAARAATQARP